MGICIMYQIGNTWDEIGQTTHAYKDRVVDESKACEDLISCFFLIILADVHGVGAKRS